MKKLFSLPLLALGAVILAASFAPGAHAVSGGNWKAGRIIDDQIFRNSSSMNTTQIQQFLDSKVSCDRWGTQTSEYGGGTRAQYGASRGNPAPYTCLNAYAENPTTHENNLDGRPFPSGGQTAAQIIASVAQSQNINPQVLIVLLQKEQGLVTDAWPWDIQYRSATGYGCPDTAPCDQQYYGFYNQVYNAARQFNIYANNPNSFNYVAGQNNYVLWSPTSSCGGSTVYIENQATASLYNYTPYQPNQAALNNLYGSGDSCSAYGNRNFWRYFNDWFGPTLLPSYAWEPIAEEYSRTASDLPATERIAVKLTVRNKGTATWYRDSSNPIVLAPSGPQGRTSAFCDKTWFSCSRIVKMQEPVVPPNYGATFFFVLQAPKTTGSVREQFNLVAENLTWADETGYGINFNVTSPTFSWETPSNTLPSYIANGQQIKVTQPVKNTGNVTWYRDDSSNFPVRLGTSSPLDRSSDLQDSTWVSPSRLANLDQPSLAPGQTGSFTFTLKGPSTEGARNENYALVSDGNTWMANNINKNIGVTGTFSGEVQPGTATTVVKGSTAQVTVKVKNTGTATWQKTDPALTVKLGTESPRDHSSLFCNSWGLGCNRPATFSETSVAPGATGTFTFTISTANATPGSYQMQLGALTDYYGWFNNDTTVPVTVEPQRFTWDLVNQYAYTDQNKTTPVDITRMLPGQRAYIGFTAKNTGNMTWTPSSVRVGTNNPRDHTSPFCDQGTWIACQRPAALHESSVAPNQNGTFEFWYVAPQSYGQYREAFNLVAEGTGWMNDPGMYFDSGVWPPTYAWQVVNQYAYTDQSMTVPVDLNNLSPGQRVFVGFTARNVGNMQWDSAGNNQVRVGTSSPYDRTSAFCDQATWFSCNRPGAVTQSVLPGYNGTFGFWYTAPTALGSYREPFNLVIDATGWFNNPGMYFDSRVR